MPEHTSHRPVSFGRAVRHHLVVVAVCLVLGVLGGWFYGEQKPARYTSTARVLVNPSSGNPYAPTPASVRQDQETSLATEAQVARSAEVVDVVAAADPDLTGSAIQRGLQVTVPPNTQILELSFTSTDADTAQRVADSVAATYLANRERRFEDVTAGRVDRVEKRTLTVVTDLRTATTNSQRGNAANRALQKRLADALQNELVSLRAQRSALDNSESPPGTVISPASSPTNAGGLITQLMPIAGGLAGLALGCLLALLLERLRGVVRSAREVETTGLPVVAAMPARSLRARLLRRHDAAAAETTVRRLRAAILELEPRPDIIAVSPAGAGASAAEASETVAWSFAKAGHRVVLVRAEQDSTSGLGSEDGLAQALLHERLRVVDLLKPSVEPLLSLLPAGRITAQSQELVDADRIRSVLTALTDAGNLVVIQAPGIDTADGEAFVGAADWGLVVVTLGETRPREVEQVTAQARTRGAVLAALVVGRGDLASSRIQTVDDDDDTSVTQKGAARRNPMMRSRR